MNTSRPMHLDLTRMTFPPMAVVSILHRLSGVVLFLLLPLALYLLHNSLHSQADFNVLKKQLLSPGLYFCVWLLTSAVCFHFFAGIRHMLMDCGMGEHLHVARVTAYAIIVLGAITACLIGVWLW